MDGPRKEVWETNTEKSDHAIGKKNWPYSSRRATRFKISSRAKRACITRAWQGQRDFLLAINLSSLVGVRLDVIQSSDVKVHYGFPGNRLPSMTIHEVRVFSSVNYNNVYGRWISSKLNNSGFNKWLEILAGKDLQQWIQQVAGNTRWENPVSRNPGYNKTSLNLSKYPKSCIKPPWGLIFFKPIWRIKQDA